MRPMLRLPREEDFSTRLRDLTVTARVGVWLGVCFAVAFGTGLVSHWAHLPAAAVPFPTRPVWGYRVTQGLHVIAGTAAVPLLLVKLWSVFPRLFARPGRGWRAWGQEALERASVAALVASAVFLLATGVANVAQWHPWSFSFRATHGAVGWVAIGALVVHIAVRAPRIRAGLAARVATGVDAEGGQDAEPADRGSAGLSRRGLLATTWLAAGLAVLTTAGATIPGLRRVSVLAARSGDGPRGIPVNRTAVAAGVGPEATGSAYRLTLRHGEVVRTLTRAELAALPQVTADLPIACVEGWSAQGRWTGVRVRDLMALVGASRRLPVRVTSLQTQGSWASTTLPAGFAADPLTLLALELDGQPLSPDHGFPARLIAPNRPGVLQTKWVASLETLT